MDWAEQEALRDELTVQEVILESLQDETFDGAEEERAEAMREIDRLKKLLNQPRPPRPSGESSRDDRNIHRHHRLPVSSQAQPALVDSSSTRLENPSPFATPQKSRMEEDFWLSPGARSLPSRKRTNQHAYSNGESSAKVRRLTPTPRGDRFESPHLTAARNNVVDIIDLTGDDVDFDADRIAAYIKEERQLQQEATDRDLALQLSSQDDGGSPPNGLTVEPGHPNVFSKMMANQSHSGNPYDNAGESSSTRPPHDPFSVNMPGSFDPSWDAPGGSAQFRTQNSFGANYPAMLPSAANPSSSFLPENSLRLGPLPPPRPQMSSLYGMSYLPARPAFPPIQSASSFHAAHSAAVLPSSSKASLMDAINRTSMFDYSSHVDAEGNAFSDRLTSFLDYARHDPEVTAKELNDLLENISPDMDLPEKYRDGTPAGLKSTLYRHQQLAVAWMIKMEEGSNKGGILADDMGLGKTISTLALMLSRPSVTRTKTNLIVGPVALIRQWEEEIKKKTKVLHRLSVFVYHGKKATTDELLGYDVVLTTYGTVAAELKRLDQFYEVNKERNIDFNDKAIAAKFPLLHPSKAVFHRVILDEAQYIKNEKTKTAKACHRLEAKYRWCLTGTPMMNGVTELYSLIKFLRIKPYCDWEKFRTAFGIFFGNKTGDPKSVALSQLRAVLKAIMLRRKKDSKLDGKPILNLPPKTESVVYAQLSEDEKAFYEQLEKSSQVIFSKYLREGTVGKNYSNILVLLLRMRQACCHPHLNLDVEDTTADGHIQTVKDLDARTVQRIKDRIAGMEAFECPICFDAVQSPAFFVPCGHDSCNDCLTRLVDNAATSALRAGEEGGRTKCPVCRGPFDPRNCFSFEAFRSVHLCEEGVKKSESDVEEADDNGDYDDSDSDSEYDDQEDADDKGNLKGFVVDDGFDASNDQIQSPSKNAGEPGRKKKRSKGKAKASDVKPSMLKALRKEAAKSRKAYKKYMQYLKATWMPSAKVTECMKLLQTIREEGGEKTIIFSQWTLLLDLLQVAMHHERFADKPLRYDGSMSSDERDKTAREFRDKPDARVMLVSLRAGNAGLNLTSANHVIIMDPFWNPYIEMQAVDRAYRIGQQREVKVYRILTKETVEDRIVALQERKKEIVEAALDETESMKIGRLNVNELRFLFNTRD